MKTLIEIWPYASNPIESDHHKSAVYFREQWKYGRNSRTRYREIVIKIPNLGGHRDAERNSIPAALGRHGDTDSSRDVIVRQLYPRKRAFCLRWRVYRRRPASQSLCRKLEADAERSIAERRHPRESHSTKMTNFSFAR